MGQIGQSSWPRIPRPWAAGLAATLYQIDQSQWWPAATVESLQFRQAKSVLAHAYAASDLYRRLYQKANIGPDNVDTWSDWRRLPIVTRADLQSAGDDWHSKQIPIDHGELMQHFSSGSTGSPLATFGTSLSYLIKMALVVRNHQWAGRKLAKKAAFILDQGEQQHFDGIRTDYWQRSLADAIETGAALAISVKLPISRQVELLQEFQPTYLFAYPSVITGLARYTLEQGIDLSCLEQVGALGEVLSPACRALADQAWGAPIVDGYSAREMGPIALQCPIENHYHVQSDAVLVEVLDAAGQPCASGETGRVVLTSLHNFASPMIRYEIGDYAEVGQPCRCGRSLPVLARILGRRRNLLTYPDGQQRWPSLSDVGFAQLQAQGLPNIRQFQIIQHSLERLEIRLCTDRPLTEAEESRARAYLHRELGAHWTVEFSYPESIARSGRGKFEDFISLCDMERSHDC